ncbi:Firmicu-CTERM sorting domain-containing protein [Levilactobacillus angrenensis]|uniref:Firmicu-CTERM sorting domain-containing protein n=1 Tax=Levilactobacillus angrenensis TaxID=2486020 RepID=A0ABW1U626_9LACO|nr:Firmicu-CTERM sorting domain-containing protein [Levilactobacillus angrenensis]
MKLWKLMIAGVVALGLAGAATVSATPVTAHASDNVTIDGKFSDWDGTSLTVGYNGYTALKSNGKYIDVYVKMKNGPVPGHGDYIFKIGGKTYHAWSNDIDGTPSKGSVKSFTVTGGSDFDGTQYGTVGAGYTTNDGSNYLGEFRIDLSKFGLKDSDNGDQVTMTNPNIGSDAAKTTVDDMSASDDANATSGVVDGKADSSSKATTTTDTNASNDNDNLNIKIDGKYEDWKDIKLTEGYGGYTALVSDGDKVYAYARMKYQTIPRTGYRFDFNGKTIYVWANDVPTNPVKHGEAVAVHFYGGNTEQDYDPNADYGQVGMGYVSSDSNGKNIIEFEIDVGKLNLSSMTGQTITMDNSSIGDKAVTVAGGSTGPYVISGIGLGIAGLGYWRLRKSGKLKRREKQTTGK